LIISGFCEFPVDKKFELRSGVADISISKYKKVKYFE
jgi:hypothetical protein